MSDDDIDRVHLRAVALAESLAKSHADDGGEITELFATFALFVTQEDPALGLRCLESLQAWVWGERKAH
jgi:hypothetical protein